MRQSSRRTCLAFAVALPLMLLILLVLLDKIPGVRDVDFLRRVELLGEVCPRSTRYRCFLGTSRVHWAVNPELLPGPGVNYNFGLAAGTPVESFFTLQRLLRLGRKPAQVVLEGWWVNIAKRNESTQWYAMLGPSEQRQLDGWRSTTRPWALADPASLEWPVTYFVPRWNPRFARTADKNNRFGWTAPERANHSAADLALHYQEVLQEHQGVVSTFPRKEQNLAAFRATLALCRKERIPCVVLMAPNSPAYRKALGGELWRKEAAFWSSLCKEFGATLLDLSEWGEDRDFLDGTHLRTAALPSYCRTLSGRLGPIPAP